MPELPEVETARRLIADQALHRRIADVDDSDTFVCRPHSPGQLRDRADRAHAHRRRPAGQDDVVRDLRHGRVGRARARSRHPPGHERPHRGGGPGRAGGRGRRAAPSAARPHRATWDRFALEFADGGRLVLVDPRRLGRVRLDPDLDALGPDAEQVTPEEFRSLILKGTIAVKARLLDQSKIAGIGNLLADEVLWQAKVSPSARVNTLRRRTPTGSTASCSRRCGRPSLRAGRTPATSSRPGIRAAPARAAARKCVHGTVGGRSTWWCSREQGRVRQTGPRSESGTSIVIAARNRHHEQVISVRGYAPPDWLAAPAEPGVIREFQLSVRALDAAVPVRTWSRKGFRTRPAAAAPGARRSRVRRAGRPHPVPVGAGSAGGWLPPLRAALLGPGPRDRWYSANARYARALAFTVIPALSGRLRSAAASAWGPASAPWRCCTPTAGTRTALDALFLQSGSFFTPAPRSPRSGGSRTTSGSSGFVADVHAGGLPPCRSRSSSPAARAEENAGEQPPHGRDAARPRLPGRAARGARTAQLHRLAGRPRPVSHRAAAAARMSREVGRAVVGRARTRPAP